jgi:hypothetical protein
MPAAKTRQTLWRLLFGMQREPKETPGSSGNGSVEHPG